MSRRITPQIASRIIDGFEQKFRSYGRGHLYLAYHAAFPLALTPELLYALWANFQRDVEGDSLKVPWIAVADLLLSALCEEVSYELYEMETAIRDELLRRLRADVRFGERRLRELARFLLLYVERQLEPYADQRHIRTEAEAQKWTALAYLEPNQAAEALAARLRQLVQEGDGVEQIRMANLMETLAEPLVEAGFTPLVVYAKGRAQEARGQHEQARGIYEQVIADCTQRLRHNPADTSLLLLRGQCYYEKGQLSEALADYDQALRLKPDDKEIERYRQQAYDLQQPPLGIGSERICAKDGMVQVYVPAGEFLMGSRDDDPDAYDDEKPQHEVYLDAYWIDKTPVTNAMFAKFVEETGYQTEAEKEGWAYGWTGSEWEKIDGANWRHPQGPNSDLSGKENHPVVSVSWNDAVAYAKWAERRLPTEAEWEKAAGGTDERKYPWGNEPPTDKLCNFNRNVGDTTPVGNYPDGASPYGALDMAGNVLEWCHDTFEAKYYASSPKANPHDESPKETKVLRGGSWGFSARVSRARSRVRDSADSRGEVRGFRCARSPSLAP